MHDSAGAPRAGRLGRFMCQNAWERDAGQGTTWEARKNFMNEQQSTAVFWTTFVLVALGVLVLAIGIAQIVRARRLERRCTAVAPATVIDLVDHPSGRIRRTKPRRAEKVEAANEEIAAKKRAYQEKQRRAARQAADESLATWSVVVSWKNADAGTLRLEGSRKHRRTRFKVGQELHVCYDPADPTCAYLREEGLSGGVGLTMLGCGVALIVLGIVCWFLLPTMAQG